MRLATASPISKSMSIASGSSPGVASVERKGTLLPRCDALFCGSGVGGFADDDAKGSLLAARNAGELQISLWRRVEGRLGSTERVRSGVSSCLNDSFLIALCPLLLLWIKTRVRGRRVGCALQTVSRRPLGILRCRNERDELSCAASSLSGLRRGEKTTAGDVGDGRDESSDSADRLLSGDGNAEAADGRLDELCTGVERGRAVGRDVGAELATTSAAIRRSGTKAADFDESSNGGKALVAPVTAPHRSCGDEGENHTELWSSMRSDIDWGAGTLAAREVCASETARFFARDPRGGSGTRHELAEKRVA